MTTPLDLLTTFLATFRSTGHADVLDALRPLSTALPTRSLQAKAVPVARHARTAAALAPLATAELASRFAGMAEALPWARTYAPDVFGAAFLDAYGYVEVLGPRGLFRAEAVSGGIVLLAPETHYPAHRHVAEEFYLPLTGGSEWAMGESGFVVRDAGGIVHHRTNVWHAMRTGAEPLLAAYIWRNGDLEQTPEHEIQTREPS